MVEIVAVSRAHDGVDLGEGPLWDPVRSVLWWVDILARDIHCYDPHRYSTRSWKTPHQVSSLASRSDGSLVVTFEDGFGTFDPAAGRIELLVPVEDDVPTQRFNDGKVDPAGRYWAGTMEHNGAPGAGTLYRLDTDMRCSAIIDKVSISNGLDWSLDGTLMYYVDTPTSRIDVFDFDVETGTLANRRSFVDIPAPDGLPDGLTVDAEGHIWVALSGGWSVRRYAPDGSISGQLELPASKITSCTFGGTELDELYITTATDGFSPKDREEQPLAGALFRARPGVPGRAPNNFGG